MSTINSTLVIQLDEAATLSSSGAVPTANTALANTLADSYDDGSLGIMLDGVFQQTPTEAVASQYIKLFASNKNADGSINYSATSEFKKSDIVSVDFSGPGQTALGTDLVFNSGSGNNPSGSTFDKDTILGVGTVEAVRRDEKAHAISSGAYNQYAFPSVNPGTNAIVGQDFYLYTISLRKDVGGRKVHEIIRVYFNNASAFSMSALETILGLGTIADVTAPTAFTVAFGATTYSVAASLDLAFTITSSENDGSYSISLNDGTTDYPNLVSGTLDASGDLASTPSTKTSADFVSGDVVTITALVTDSSGNSTTATATTTIIV